MKNKQLDSYSILIVSKYFKLTKDYMNLICVCKKFEETTEKLRFNPISIKSLKLFPKIQTQYLYNYYDLKIKGIDNYEIWYRVNYDEYLKQKENIKYHYINYTYANRLSYGDIIPIEVTELGYICFYHHSALTSINLPPSIKSLGKSCFNDCSLLKSITLPSSLQTIGDCCFYDCKSLKSITLPFTLKSLGNWCFYECNSLKSITLPSSLSSLSIGCFSFCYALKTIDLPLTLTSIGNECFSNCKSLQSITGVKKLKIGKNCFEGCDNLEQKPSNSTCIIS